MNCERCGKWAGAHATLPGQARNHLCVCVPPLLPFRTGNDFLQRTNAEYVEWCASYYDPSALDERGMQSLHGLWAWQEQERRKQALLPAADLDVRKILLDIVPGDGSDHEVYAKTVADVEKKLLEMGDLIEALESKLAAAQKPVQQPSSQPIGYMSPQQIPLVHDPEDGSGNYVPMRKTPVGLFTLALYTRASPAQSLRLDKEVILRVLRRHNSAHYVGKCFNPQDFARSIELECAAAWGIKLPPEG